jgi:glucokinase
MPDKFLEEFRKGEHYKPKSQFVFCEINPGEVDVEYFSPRSCETTSTAEYTYSKPEEFYEKILPEISGKNPGHIEKIVLCCSGPVRYNKRFCKLTHGHLTLDAEKIANLTKTRVALLNKFKVRGYVISAYKKNLAFLNRIELLHQDLYKGEEINGENIGIFGSEHGCGTAHLEFIDNEYIPVSSEGGHKFLSINPTDIEEIKSARFLSRLRAEGKTPQLETIISDQGIEDIYEFYTGKKYRCPFSEDHHLLTTKSKFHTLEIARAAKEKEPCAFKTINLFLMTLGRALHDHAVINSTWGGIYIASRVARQIVLKDNKTDEFVSGIIMRAFDEGTSLQEMVSKTPVYVIMDDDLISRGAKYVATNQKIFERERWKPVE